MALALIYGSVDAISFWGFQRLSFLFDSFLLPSLQWANVWVEASIAGPPPPLSWWDEGARATLKLWVFRMPCQPLARAHVLRSPSPIGSLRLADRIQHINFLPTLVGGSLCFMSQHIAPDQRPHLPVSPRSHTAAGGQREGPCALQS
jgi:hypothetical protein